jgi:hypothetical protein
MAHSDPWTWIHSLSPLLPLFAAQNTPRLSLTTACLKNARDEFTSSFEPSLSVPTHGVYHTWPGDPIKWTLVSLSARLHTP